MIIECLSINKELEQITLKNVYVYSSSVVCYPENITLI